MAPGAPPLAPAISQDYGYFYENGLPFPDCGSVSLPIDRCYRCGSLVQESRRAGEQESRRAG